MFTAFERVLCPPLDAYRLIYCELMRRLHVVFHFSMTCAPPSRGLSLHVQKLDTQLMVVPRIMRVYTRVICFETRHWCCRRCLLIELLGCCVRHLFCLLGLV
jgi:hypothetical protein